MIDDGSPDRCGAICDEYAAEDERIKVIHQKNQGVSVARNAGLDVATGDYICFVDSDDWIELDCLKTVYDKGIRGGKDLVIFSYREVWGESFDRVFPQESDIKVIKENFVSDAWRNFTWNKVYKRTLFDGLRYPVGMSYEDLYLIPQVIYNATQITVLQDVLYNYNQLNVGSITKTKNFNNCYALFAAYRQNARFAKEHNMRCSDVCVANTYEVGQHCILEILPVTAEEQNKLSDINQFLSENRYIIDCKCTGKQRYKILHNEAKLAWKTRDLTNSLKYYFLYCLRKVRH